ncbi:hypothetical protein VTK73DRAFT_1931 [Phialemonium thermophilum]|uniref:Thioredoxin domain-containing protein n=1 Tax=Phialemonium thermophilum TaxID=223376 RepID=A0ABR3X7S3_9PEZI
MSLDIKSTLLNEWKAFKAPPAKSVAQVPKVGDKAPTSDKLTLPADKPTVIVFLRHCGDPFAAKTFKLFTQFSNDHRDVNCIAVSHSSQTVTDQWIVDLGGEWEVTVLVDEDRDLYAQWGLGIASTWQTLNPRTIYSAYSLARNEGIYETATGSGSKWQTGGAFAIDSDGVVRWVKVATAADDIPDFGDALKALGLPS